MKALVLEKDYDNETVKDIFQNAGVETFDRFDPLQQYDFVYTHFTGDYSLTDRIKKEQPQCCLMVYNSTILENAREGTLNAEFKRELKLHFDELLYSSNNRSKAIREIIAKRKQVDH